MGRRLSLDEFLAQIRSLENSRDRRGLASLASQNIWLSRNRYLLGNVAPFRKYQSLAFRNTGQVPAIRNGESHAAYSVELSQPIRRPGPMAQVYNYLRTFF